MIVPAAVVVTLIICSIKKSNNVNDEGTISGSSDNNSTYMHKGWFSIDYAHFRFKQVYM